MTLEQASQIYYINKEIKTLQLELARLEEDRTYYKPIIMSDLPKGRGQHRNIADDYIEKKSDIQNMINYSLNKLLTARQQFEEFLLSVDDAEMRLILRLRCINLMSWVDIGTELNMSRMTASRKFYDFFKVVHNVHKECDIK